MDAGVRWRAIFLASRDFLVGRVGGVVFQAVWCGGGEEGEDARMERGAGILGDERSRGGEVSEAARRSARRLVAGEEAWDGGGDGKPAGKP
jgi:hypothetical protein